MQGPYVPCALYLLWMPLVNPHCEINILPFWNFFLNSVFTFLDLKKVTTPYDC